MVLLNMQILILVFAPMLLLIVFGVFMTTSFGKRKEKINGLYYEDELVNNPQ